MIEERQIRAPVSRLHALDLPPEEAIDVRRYVNALRRSRVLIAAIVIGLTGLVLLLSLALPKTFTAQATILFDESPSVTATTDAQRQLATIQRLLMTRDVLALSAQRLGTSVGSLQPKVQATVDPNANIVNISASASTPKAAAATANAVAAAFLARERAVELASLQTAKKRLTNAILRLAGTRGGKAEILLLRERLSELSVTAATAGNELQLADAARPPTRATSPRPVRNAAFAFVAALFIAVLVALGRERIAPRVGERRDLERLSGVPIVTEIPDAGRGADGAAAEREAFDTLAAVVGAQLPRQRQKVLLVTSAARGQGQDAGDGRAEPCSRAVGRDCARRRCRPSPALPRAAIRNGTRAGARRDPRRSTAWRYRDGRGDDRRASGVRLVAAPDRHPGRSRSRRGRVAFTRLPGRSRGSVRRASRVGVHVRRHPRATAARARGLPSVGSSTRTRCWSSRSWRRCRRTS